MLWCSVTELFLLELVPPVLRVVHILFDSWLHVVLQVVVGLVQPDLPVPRELVDQSEVLAVADRFGDEVAPVLLLDLDPELAGLLEVEFEHFTVGALLFEGFSK